GGAAQYLRYQRRGSGARLHGCRDGAARLGRVARRRAQGDMDRARGRGRLADGADRVRWIERQLPEGGEAFLDHVGYFVPDLDAAGRKLERLGFRVSAINVQTNADASGALKPSGTSNRLAKLKFGFVELLAATHDTPLADQFRQQIARYSGLHLIALSAADMRRERARD